MNQSIEFLQAIDELQHKKIPEEVLARVRQSLLDYLAVCAAGVVFKKKKLINTWHSLCRNPENLMRLVQERDLR